MKKYTKVFIILRLSHSSKTHNNEVRPHTDHRNCGLVTTISVSYPQPTQFSLNDQQFIHFLFLFKLIMFTFSYGTKKEKNCRQVSLGHSHPWVSTSSHQQTCFLKDYNCFSKRLSLHSSLNREDISMKMSICLIFYTHTYTERGNTYMGEMGLGEFL